MEFAQIILRLGAADELVDIDTVEWHAKSETVRLGDFIYMVGGERSRRRP